LKKEEKIFNYLVLAILGINFIITGFIVGNSILNNLNSQDNQEINKIKNLSDDLTSVTEDTSTKRNQIGNNQYLNSISSDEEGDSQKNNPYPSSKFLLVESGENWENSSFEYKKSLVIDETKVSGLNNLTNFPLLIDIFDSDLRTNVQPDGDDIIFTDDKGTILDYEIEVFDQTYNSTHAHLVTWVRIPSLYATVDTEISMYYGNSTIGSNENPTGVWDTNYDFVLHMNQDPSSSNILDSTSNNFDFYVNPNSGMTTGDLIDGQTGKALDFDGINDIIILPSSSGFSGPTSKISFAFRIKFPTGHGPADPAEELAFPNTASGEPRIRFFNNMKLQIDTGLGSQSKDTVQDTWVAGTWYYVVSMWDGTGVGLEEHYIDGSFDSNETHADYQGTHLTWNTWTIGGEDQGSNVSDNEIYATLSEFRLLNEVRSPQWIATEYANQIDPINFYDISPEKVKWDFPDYLYRKSINIDNTKVSGSSTLTDFPVLIDLYDTDLRSKVQSDGDDIVFTDTSGSKLAHEFEQFVQDYNSTHARLTTWIGVPNLFTTVDTELIMYYGNATVSSNENTTGIWNSNYKGVWHLSEDPSGVSPQMLDSTSNNYDGTTSGTMTSGDQISGQIGGSIDLDGLDDYITTNYAGVTGSNARTVTFWINTNNLEDRDIISYGNFADNRFIIRIDESSTIGDWVIRLEMKDATNLVEQRWSTNLIDGNWHYVSIVIPQNVDITQTLCYVDGQLESVDTTFGTGTADSGSGGANNFQMAYTLNKNGLWGSLDEVRISDITYSADWIATEYNNQFGPLNFYTTSSAESQLSWSHTEYQYRKSITIDKTKVSGSSNLIDFPILVDFYDLDLRNKVQPDEEILVLN
jgi:hypothetical protein